MNGAAAPADKFYLKKRIRTFVYLSSAKLEPLYHQIKEPARKRIALTLGISVPVFPIAPKVEAEIRPPTTNEMDMLAIVLSHLDEAGGIGTVDEPLGYFAGQLTLRWAAATEFLFLSGSTAQTLVALTGSNRHMVGHFEPELGHVSYPGSSRFGVESNLDRIFADAEEHGDDENVNLVAQLALSRGGPGARRRGLQETFEFVARRLAHDDVSISANWTVAPDKEHLKDRDFKVLHGTPLYLAYPD
jgi:hypothetical protein